MATGQTSKLDFLTHHEAGHDTTRTELRTKHFGILPLEPERCCERSASVGRDWRTRGPWQRIWWHASTALTGQ
jgi:hypothetical protein